MKSRMPSMLLAAVALFLPQVLCSPPDLEQRAGWFNNDNETVCYGRIGCLMNTDGWYKLERPFNPLPTSRDAVGTNFKLYTRENKEGETLKVDENEQIQSKYFKSERETKFIIHGFLGKGSADWVMDMMEAFLQRMDANVVIVDWSTGASNLYPYAAANTRVVGLEIAYLINNLIKHKGASAEKFHLIGHSLGSHISGYAGERIPNLGRITGLDPAGPYFTNMPTYVRLDPSDAKLVDTIHTDASVGYGTKQQMGDMDFYPNGGKNQPGCFITSTEENLSDLPSCSHGRSEQLFLESILSTPFYEDGKDNKCPFISFNCESYEDFLNGDCISCGEDYMKCALMGLDADKYPGLNNPEMKKKKFYLMTNGAAPFCGYHYNVNVTLAKESEGQEKVVGDLSIIATGENGTAKDVDLTPNGARTMVKGNSYSFLGFSSVQTGKVSNGEIKWKWNPSWFSKIICLFCNKNLYLAEAEVTDLGYYPPEKESKSTGEGESQRKRVLGSQAREMVFNLRSYFEAEKNNNAPLLTLKKVIDRTSAALKISHSTVVRIRREKYGREEEPTSQLRTLGKKRESKALSMDSFQESTIRLHIHQYYLRKEYPTIRKLLVTLKEAGLFSGERTSFIHQACDFMRNFHCFHH